MNLSRRVAGPARRAVVDREALDRELCRRWCAGKNLPSPAIALGRTESGVESRRVRLDRVAGRDEARARR